MIARWALRQKFLLVIRATLPLWLQRNAQLKMSLRLQ